MEPMTYRDRQGQEIALLEWAGLWENMSYRVAPKTGWATL